MSPFESRCASTKLTIRLAISLTSSTILALRPFAKHLTQRVIRILEKKLGAFSEFPMVKSFFWLYLFLNEFVIQHDSHEVKNTLLGHVTSYGKWPILLFRLHNMCILSARSTGVGFCFAQKFTRVRLSCGLILVVVRFTLALFHANESALSRQTHLVNCKNIAR